MHFPTEFLENNATHFKILKMTLQDIKYCRNEPTESFFYFTSTVNSSPQLARQKKLKDINFELSTLFLRRKKIIFKFINPLQNRIALVYTFRAKCFCHSFYFLI